MSSKDQIKANELRIKRRKRMNPSICAESNDFAYVSPVVALAKGYTNKNKRKYSDKSYFTDKSIHAVTKNKFLFIKPKVKAI